jgi:hypothetical protein
MTHDLLLTAVLLFAQFSILRSRALLAIASGYRCLNLIICAAGSLVLFVLLYEITTLYAQLLRAVVQMLKVPSSQDSPSPASLILYRYTRLFAVRPPFSSGSSVASNVASMRGSVGDMKKVSAIIRLAASSDSLP